MKSAPVIHLSSEERRTLLAWSRGRRTPARLVLRAKIVLAAAEGSMNKDIAAHSTRRGRRSRWGAAALPRGA